ncbi:hypothetical protein PG993_006558 [Apiospora rasikravindrae]|uniref:N-acetyltransferase domain-containing protein n=1 Tax=Apiospora rasikravindrae TaxID=990691 RepID=A0ABR1T7U2_9PEZI
MTDSDNNPVSDWAIELIPPNDAGRAFYLTEYKPFRLAALKRDPEAFGSTYAREAAFPDENWLQRLSNPRIKTFVAVRRHDRHILSAVSLIGPMPHAGQTVSNPTQALLSQTAPSGHGSSTTSTGRKESGEGREKEEIEEGEHRHGDDDNGVTPFLLYQNTGVYTRPEARGKGLGLKLMATAVECARQEARRGKQPCQLGVEVYKTNQAAIAFYRKCGFEVRGTKVPEKSKDDENRPEFCMYYKDLLL